MGDIGPVRERYEVLPVGEPVLPQPAPIEPEPEPRLPTGRRNRLSRTTRALR